MGNILNQTAEAAQRLAYGVLTRIPADLFNLYLASRIATVIYEVV